MALTFPDDANVLEFVLARVGLLFGALVRAVLVGFDKETLEQNMSFVPVNRVLRTLVRLFEENAEGTRQLLAQNTTVNLETVTAAARKDVRKLSALLFNATPEQRVELAETGIKAKKIRESVLAQLRENPENRSLCTMLLTFVFCWMEKNPAYVHGEYDEDTPMDQPYTPEGEPWKQLQALTASVKDMWNQHQHPGQASTSTKKKADKRPRQEEEEEVVEEEEGEPQDKRPALVLSKPGRTAFGQKIDTCVLFDAKKALEEVDVRGLGVALLRGSRHRSTPLLVGGKNFGVLLTEYQGQSRHIPLFNYVMSLYSLTGFFRYSYSTVSVEPLSVKVPNRQDDTKQWGTRLPTNEPMESTADEAVFCLDHLDKDKVKMWVVENNPNLQETTCPALFSSFLRSVVTNLEQGAQAKDALTVTTTVKNGLLGLMLADALGIHSSTDPDDHALVVNTHQVALVGMTQLGTKPDAPGFMRDKNVARAMPYFRDSLVVEFTGAMGMILARLEATGRVDTMAYANFVRGRVKNMHATYFVSSSDE